jgi:metal-sulfur cluster biosynthetic enzyme
MDKQNTQSMRKITCDDAVRALKDIGCRVPATEEGCKAVGMNAAQIKRAMED